MSPLRGFLSTLLLLWGHSLVARAEQSINCVSYEGFVYPGEWERWHRSTPPDLSDLKVIITATPSRTPLLNISWTLSAAGGITELKATFIRIRTLDNGAWFSIRCNYTEQFNSPYGPNRQPWKFYYDEFQVKPETVYVIKAFNIPTANQNEDPPSMSVKYSSPGCKENIMKYSESCIAKGSLWNPNISACIIEQAVEVNFSLYSYGTKYEIQLYNCSSPTALRNKACRYIDTVGTTENNKSRTSVLIPVDKKLPYAFVLVYTFLPACQNDCHRHLKQVDCNRTEVTHLQDTGPGKPATGTKFFIVFLTIMCVIFGLAGALYCIWKHGQAMIPIPIFDFRRKQAVKVLIVYPSESALLKKTILSFAKFLHDYCRADVILDLQQKRKLAEMGHVQWLVAQKEAADKIIFLCSSSSGSSLIGSSATEKPNHKDADGPEKMFTLALNLFCSDLINQSSLHKYMVVYYSEANPKGALPSVLRMLPMYCLMKDVMLFCEDLHSGAWIHRQPDIRSKRNMNYAQEFQKRFLEQQESQFNCPSVLAENGESEYLVMSYTEDHEHRTPTVS